MSVLKRLVAAAPLALISLNANADITDKFTTVWATTLSTNYVERAESKNQNDPALGAAFVILSDNTNFYGTVLGHNTAQTDVNGATATLELKPGLGFYYNWDEYNTDIDVQLRYYFYPGYKGLDYPELMVNLKNWIFRGEVGFSNDVFDSGTDGHYLQAGLDIPLEMAHPALDTFFFDGFWGHYHLGAAAGDSYDYYKLAVRKEHNTYEIGYEYWNMDNNSSLKALNRYGHHSIFYVTKYF
ncbi:MAG: hypothetical protein CMF48_02595 [Legionellales bacterium]|nr:hypothetical protein [Legionellales bacterium]|tara:strand:- start:60 stop:782 length:723 start_codon:yes stop_codon:yes gene_type:complete